MSKQKSDNDTQAVKTIPNLTKTLREATLDGDDDDKPDNDVYTIDGAIPLIRPCNLPSEGSKWGFWRVTEPVEDLKDGDSKDGDSRDGRYQKALETHSKQPWPVPYESFANYLKRQTDVLGRSPDEHWRIDAEWMAWRTSQPRFYPSDDKRFKDMLQEKFKEYMITNGHWKATE